MRRQPLVALFLFVAFFVAALWWNAGRLNAVEQELVGAWLVDTDSWTGAAREAVILLPNRRCVRLFHHRDNGWIVHRNDFVIWRANERTFATREPRYWPQVSSPATWLDYMASVVRGHNWHATQVHHRSQGRVELHGYGVSRLKSSLQGFPPATAVLTRAPDGDLPHIFENLRAGGPQPASGIQINQLIPALPVAP